MTNAVTRNELKQRLSAVGLKATHQRIVVYEALTALHGHHPVAEAVYQLLKPAHPTISLGTVYKTLDSFVETGLIKRVLTEAGGKRYDTNLVPHSHIYCSNTKEILDYEDAELDALVTDFFRKKNLENFDMSSVSVQLNGVKKDPEGKISIK